MTAPPSTAVDNRTRALLAVGMLAVSFAAILIRSAAAPAVALAFWRSFGGAVALAPFARRATVRPTAPERRAMMLGGAFLAVHFALFIGSLSFTTVASAVVFTTTAPLFVGIGSWVVLRQPPTRRTWTGIGVAILGAAVVGLADAGSGAGGSNPLLGDAMAVGAAIAVSGYLIIGQRTRARLDVATYGTWVYGVAAVVLVGMAVIGGVPLIGFDAPTWWAIVGLIVGPQLLGHTIFNFSMSRVPATTVSVVVLSEPLGAGFLAFLVLGEVPPPLLAVGAPLILAGVWLASTGSNAPAPIEPVVG